MLYFRRTDNLTILFAAVNRERWFFFMLVDQNWWVFFARILLRLSHHVELAYWRVQKICFVLCEYFIGRSSWVNIDGIRFWRRYFHFVNYWHVLLLSVISREYSTVCWLSQWVEGSVESKRLGLWKISHLFYSPSIRDRDQFFFCSCAQPWEAWAGSSLTHSRTKILGSALNSPLHSYHSILFYPF